MPSRAWLWRFGKEPATRPFSSGNWTEAISRRRTQFPWGLKPPERAKNSQGRDSLLTGWPTYPVTKQNGRTDVRHVPLAAARDRSAFREKPQNGRRADMSSQDAGGITAHRESTARPVDAAAGTVRAFWPEGWWRLT